MKFIVEFKLGQATITTVQGLREVNPDDLRADTALDVIRAEQTIERLTGLRVHIIQRGE